MSDEERSRGIARENGLAFAVRVASVGEREEDILDRAERFAAFILDTSPVVAALHSSNGRLRSE